MYCVIIIMFYNKAIKPKKNKKTKNQTNCQSNKSTNKTNIKTQKNQTTEATSRKSLYLKNDKPGHHCHIYFITFNKHFYILTVLLIKYTIYTNNSSIKQCFAIKLIIISIPACCHTCNRKYTS